MNVMLCTNVGYVEQYFEVSQILFFTKGATVQKITIIQSVGANVK